MTTTGALRPHSGGAAHDVGEDQRHADQSRDAPQTVAKNVARSGTDEREEDDGHAQQNQQNRERGLQAETKGDRYRSTQDENTSNCM